MLRKNFRQPCRTLEAMLIQAACVSCTCMSCNAICNNDNYLYAQMQVAYNPDTAATTFSNVQRSIP